MNPDWQNLAQHISARRLALGLNQADIEGVSTATMTKLENAAAEGYRPSTLAALERALKWSHGSVEAILAGGEPTLAPVTHQLSGSATLVSAAEGVAAGPATRAEVDEVRRAVERVESLLVELAAEVRRTRPG